MRRRLKLESLFFSVSSFKAETFLVSEIILQKQPWSGAEVGIETGSPELAKSYASENSSL